MLRSSRAFLTLGALTPSKAINLDLEMEKVIAIRRILPEYHNTLISYGKDRELTDLPGL